MSIKGSSSDTFPIVRMNNAFLGRNALRKGCESEELNPDDRESEYHVKASSNKQTKEPKKSDGQSLRMFPACDGQTDLPIDVAFRELNHEFGSCLDRTIQVECRCVSFTPRSDMFAWMRRTYI